MFQSFIQLPSGLVVLIITGGTIFIFEIGLWLKMKFFPQLLISNRDNHSANILFYLISTLFTVVLAFVVVTAWQDYEKQQKNTGLEACTLGNLYRDSRGFDEQTENEIQRLIIHYTGELVQDGWPAMREDRESKRAWVAFNELYGKVIRLSPNTKSEEQIFSQMLGQMNELATFRRLRILRNQTPVVPAILTWSIFLASIVTVFFSYLLKVQNRRIDRLMISLLGFMLGIVFSLIILLNYPYKSSIRVSTFPLENLLNDVFPSAEITKVK